MSNLNKFNKGIWWAYSNIILKGKLAHFGKQSVVFKPLQIDNPNSICINDKVFIAEGAWLMGNKESKVSLSINEGTVIGHFSHIISKESVEIGKSVLIADRVFISDCTHEYENIDMPIIDQPVKTLSKVVIGDETWIGENVCILGASIGKHCVVGSNSVVMNDIPDYCVAAGNPAKVIKKYDFDKKEWVKV